MSHYEQEILEQPQAIKRLFANWEKDPVLKALGEEYRSEKPELVFVGMGSSNYAPIVIRSRLSGAGCDYKILEAGELFHYEMGQVKPESWVIAISQSGESIETQHVADALKGKVRKTITITNEPGSSLDKLADVTLFLHAEKELGSTTKTFINTLLALQLLADALLGETTVTETVVHSLATVFESQTPLLREKTKEVIQYLGIPDLSTLEPVHLIARGPMMATAMQTALILAETTDLFVDAMAGGTFRHGPKELAGPNHRAIVFAPSGKTQDLLIKIAKEIHELGSKVVLLSDTEEAFPFFQVKLPKLSEELAPLLYFLPMEWFGLNTSFLRGREPGMMRHMGKVTTVE